MEVVRHSQCHSPTERSSNYIVWIHDTKGGVNELSKNVSLFVVHGYRSQQINTQHVHCSICRYGEKISKKVIDGLVSECIGRTVHAVAAVCSTLAATLVATLVATLAGTVAGTVAGTLAGGGSPFVTHALCCLCCYCRRFRCRGVVMEKI